jgi:hypothetical protein
MHWVYVKSKDKIMGKTVYLKHWIGKDVVAQRKARDLVIAIERAQIARERKERYG